MKVLDDIGRCTGSYEGLHGEFGVTLNPTCIDCARRLVKSRGDWVSTSSYVIPSGTDVCPHKLKVIMTRKSAQSNEKLTTMMSEEDKARSLACTKRVLEALGKEKLFIAFYAMASVLTLLKGVQDVENMMVPSEE